MNFSTEFGVSDRVYLVDLSTQTITRNTITVIMTKHNKDGIEIEYWIGGSRISDSSETYALFRSKKRAVAFLEEKVGSFLEVQKKRFSDQINFYKRQLEAAQLGLEKLLTNKQTTV